MTLQEAKDQVAKKNGYLSWKDIEAYVKRGTFVVSTFIHLHDEASNLFNSELVKENDLLNREIDEMRTHQGKMFLTRI